MRWLAPNIKEPSSSKGSFYKSAKSYLLYFIKSDVPMNGIHVFLGGDLVGHQRTPCFECAIIIRLVGCKEGLRLQVRKVQGCSAAYPSRKLHLDILRKGGVHF